MNIRETLFPKGVTPLWHPEPPKPQKLFAATASPRLTYRGGPLMSNFETHVIFWGKSWQSQTNLPYIGQLNAFFDYVCSSPYVSALSEYSTGGFSLGSGSHASTRLITSSSPFFFLTDGGVRNFLKTQIQNPNFPQPGPSVLYFIFLPPGVYLQMGLGLSCLTFCGYHNQINNNIFYAPIPFTNCGSCRGPLTTIDALTSITSHELAEAVTDPIPGSGWYDDNYGEIGDICAWKTKKMNGFTLQLEWSNQANSCV